MNIFDLTNELNNINEKEKLLNEEISKLETSRIEKENSQLRLVGQEIKRVPKSVEQINLENERQALTINKNRIINLDNMYKRIKVISSNSEFNGMNINDFIKFRDNYDLERKQVGEEISILENERIKKELDSLSIIGQLPKVPKSEKQIALEEKKQLLETRYQLMVRTISIYNGIKKEIESLSNEKDILTKVNGLSKIIYNANKQGFPEQLLVNLLEGKELVEKKEEVKEEEKVISTKEENTYKIDDFIKPEIKEEPIFNSREEEINYELDRSMKRLKEALVNNDESVIANERSYRQRLLNELFKIKQEAKQKEIDEKVKVLEKELVKSKERLDEAKLIGDDSLITKEIGERQRILLEIGKLKGFNEPQKLNTFVKPVTDKVKEEPISLPNPVKEETIEEPKEERSITKSEEIETLDESKQEVIKEPVVNPKSKEEQEVKSSKVSTPRPLPPKPTSNLSIEDINRMLPILEKQRKEIDSRIVKIDLNAPFENDIDLMKEYVVISKKINDLKEELKKKEEKEIEKVLNEIIIKDKEEPKKEEEKTETEVEVEAVPEINEDEEIKEETEEENASNENEEEQEDKKEKRKFKFRRFIPTPVSNFFKKTGFGIRRLFSRNSDFNIDDSLLSGISSNTNTNVSNKENEEKHNYNKYFLRDEDIQSLPHPLKDPGEEFDEILKAQNEEELYHLSSLDDKETEEEVEDYLSSIKKKL